MADCKGAGCKEKNVTSKSGLCNKCLRKQEEAKKIEQQKEKMAKELAEKQDAMKKAAELQKKNEEQAAAKKKRIAEIAVLWNGQIKPLADSVEALRKKNPGKAGINAGSNAGVIPTGGGNATTVTIVGGTNNPLVLTLPSDAEKFKITKKDVFDQMKPANSDSGMFKFIKGDKIFIHCK